MAYSLLLNPSAEIKPTQTMKKPLALAAVALGLLSASAFAQQLIQNGDFETGALGPWSVFDLNATGNTGSFYLDAPGTTTPVSSQSTLGSPANGQFYAVSDQNGWGTHALIQSFTVPSDASTVLLQFDMFVNDYDSGPIVNPAGLDFTAGPNQHARVDILTAGAGAFDTTPAGVVQNLYTGVDPGSDPNAFKTYVFNLTGVVTPGETYQLRFAEVDNQLYLNQGVDNVSIYARTSGTVPDGGSTLMLLSGCMGLVAMFRARKQS